MCLIIFYEHTFVFVLQIGCIHANMDLFKYAVQLYPLIGSDVLLDSVKLAIQARKIDMRASPYDVSAFEGCADILDVETIEGKRKYITEQEALARQSAPLREKILDMYNGVLNIINEK